MGHFIVGGVKMGRNKNEGRIREERIEFAGFARFPITFDWCGILPKHTNTKGYRIEIKKKKEKIQQE